jgi:hypothetical protein
MAEEWNIAGEPLPDIKPVKFDLGDFDRIRLTIHSTASYRALICLLLVAILVFAMSWTFMASISQVEIRSTINVILAFPTALSIIGILLVAIAVISATIVQRVIINREARVISFVYLVLGVPIRKNSVTFEDVLEIKQLTNSPLVFRRIPALYYQNYIGFVLRDRKEIRVANSFSLNNDDQEKLMHYLHNTIILEK